MEKISITIPVHDLNSRLLYISKVLGVAENDERIAEVVLSLEPHESWAMPLGGKIKKFENKVQEFVFRNKFLAVERSSSEWVAIIDSDNTFTSDYLDALYMQQPWNRMLIYQPEFALPKFDFREFSGKTIAGGFRGLMQRPMFRCMLNAMNYIVNRQVFLDANRPLFESGFDPKCADSLFINYNLFKEGCGMFVVPGMQYQHTVHDGSFYKQNAKMYGHLVREMEEKFKLLK